jgi:hypothetical protein
MALEPGGYADKLGNRYEGRWVVRQLLRVLSERLRSVTCEAVGDDEHGVDLWIEHLDGVRQDQQCKIRNVSKNHWSIADLGQRGILSAMKGHLDREPTNQFALVTPLPAILVHDMCESARNSSGDPEEFFAYQVEAVGEDRRKGFRQFCERLGLNSESQNDRAQAFSYLQRLFIETWPDTSSSREDIIGQAGMLVRVDPDGDPSTVVAVLADFAHENLRKPLDAVAIWQHLELKGFHPRRLSNDTRVVPSIQTLQRQFAESISGDLIAGKLIDRAETQKILESVKSNAVVVLHGSPGQGKSGVLYGLTSEFNTQNIAYLPLRLDRQEPQKTVRQYGAELGLPESPVMCLSAVARDRPAVLILDQLDAIRWTSRHSVGALEVCKELVREIRSLRATGQQASVVLACRTYDMQNDPDIKSWLQSEKQRDGKLVEITVEPLSAEAVAGVVTSLGQNPNQMSERQRAILQSPQHLAMWVRIAQDIGKFEFQNRVQLMRAYWNGRMREMAQWGVSESDANRVLTSIVHYLEQHGRISAPRSLVVETTILDALCACGLLRANDGQITFSHQSYLDYQIANRVVREINASNQNICVWLGPRERQSLIRREQLRQALCLLSEESANGLLETVKTILGSSDVRFHLKHLCLEVIGQLDNPSGAILAYLKDLVATDEWKEHILGTVFLGHPPFVKLLIEDGTISQWLEDDQWCNASLWMLRNLADLMPDEVVKVLAPYAERDGEWKKRVLACLLWHPENDSDSMFELRLELARQGEFHEYVDWEKLPGHRAIRLLEAVLSYWEPADLPKDYSGQSRQRSRFEHWSDRDLAALLRAVRDLPEQAWAMFVPHICRLGPQSNEPARPLELWLDGDHHGIRQGNECIPHGLVQLVIESGRCLAKRDGLAFWKETKSLRSHVSPVIQFLLVETYSSLPSEVADEALEWLMEDSSRFALGMGHHEPEWKPAARLVEALSPLCSLEVFHKLEHAIIHYHSPDERRHAEYCLSAWKNGYFDDYWGRAQHFLLPALCTERQNQTTVGLIGVLARKYASYSEDRLVRDGGVGFSSVGSTLPTKALDCISDKAWLDIVGNRSISEDDYRMRRWKDGHWAESTVRTFSHDLEQIAKRFPERFGQLALRFPDNVHSLYKAAILDGIKQTEPKEVPDDEKATWRPAPASLVEQVLAKFVGTIDETYAITFCRLLRDRAEERWPDAALRQLMDYASHHPDPESGKLCIGNNSGNFDSAQATVDNLENNAINCVRGVAALAIGEQLWNHPDLLDQFRQTITQLCEDPHPAVRVAAIRACLPILNLDKDFAIECLCRASADDLRVAASHGAVYFFNTGMQSHQEQLTPIVTRMLAGSQADVVEEGAEEVAARWLFHDYFAKELEDCLQGSVPQRKGLAHVAVHFVTKPERFAKCSRIINRFQDDPEKNVRQSLLPMVRSIDILKFREGITLVQSFVESQAFRDDPTALIFGLNDYSGNLLPFSDVLFSICAQFVGPLRDASRDSSLGILHDVPQFVRILMRLHEQAEEAGNSQVVNKCLDAWDAMFERRVGVVHELARAIG